LANLVNARWAVPRRDKPAPRHGPAQVKQVLEEQDGSGNTSSPKPQKENV